MISAKPLSEYQKEDFEKIIKNWIENDKGNLIQKDDKSKIDEIIQEATKSFQELLRKDPKACNLRDLKESLQNIWKGPNSQEIAGRG